MLSLLSLTVCGGIGVITPMDGEAILIMVGEVTHLIIVTAAGPMVGAASTVAGVGDGDTITIITILEAVGIPAVDTGEVAIGIAVAYIQTDVFGCYFRKTQYRYFRQYNSQGGRYPFRK